MSSSKRPKPLDPHLRSGTFHPPNKKRPKFDVRNPSTLASGFDDDATETGGPEINDELDLDSVGVGGRRVKRNAVNIEGYESDSSNEGYERKSIEVGDSKKLKGKAKGKGKRKDEEDDEDDDMFGDGDDEDIDDSADLDNGGKDRKGGKFTSRDKKKGVRFLDLDEIEGQEFESKREYDDFLDGQDGDGGDVSDDDSDDDSDEDRNQNILSRGIGKEEILQMKEADRPNRNHDGGEEDDINNGEIDPEVGAGGKKKHAPKIDAFNMKNEMEEGRFDDAGNFVRKAKDADAVHDSWLEGVSRKDMKRAKEAMEKREKERIEKMKEDDMIVTSDVLSDLIQCLEVGETPLEALARLGSKNKKKKKKKWIENKNTRWKKKAEAARMDIDVGAGEQDEEDLEAEVEDRKRRELVEKITGAADVLLTRGQLEIYEETREMLMRQFKRETGDDWVGPNPTAANGDGNSGEQADSNDGKTKWEYRWTDGRENNEVHGPYSAAEMTSWNTHGFFGAGVEFRKVGSSSNGWTVVAEFD